MQIRRYLEYKWEMKKKIKVEETEVMDLLNEYLKDKVLMQLNARVLKNIKVLTNFDIEYLSQLTFTISMATFSIDEDIVVEGDEGNTMYYIVNGKAAIIHKESKTFISNIHQESYFGEIAMFSTMKRVATVKSRDFTEAYIMNRMEMLKVAQEFGPALQRLDKI